MPLCINALNLDATCSRLKVLELLILEALNFDTITYCSVAAAVKDICQTIY